MRFSRLIFFSSFLLLIVAFGGCSSVRESRSLEGTPSRLLSEGKRYIARGIYDGSIESFSKILEDYPYTVYAAQAQIFLADSYYAKEDYEDAASYYTDFAAMHPSDQKAPYALFRKGMSHFKQVLTMDRDQSSTKKAMFAFQDLVRDYPDSIYADKSEELIHFLEERLAEREFYVGKFYYRDSNYTGAVARFKYLVRNYPDVSILDKTLYYMARSYLRRGESKRALNVFSILREKFPDSHYAGKARSYIRSLE